VARLTRRVVAAVSIALAAVGLSACGTGGAVAEARASCRDVHRALAIERRSQAPGLDAARREALANAAMAELLRGTPAAAAATSADGSWNPLMTTINEAERVPLRDLVPALTRLCALADSKEPYMSAPARPPRGNRS